MARVIAQGDMRPFKGRSAAMDEIRKLLADRERLYSRADATVDTSGKTLKQSLAELQERPHMITFETHPDRYNHWKLGFDGPVATLALDIAEDAGIEPGYKLKLNSYDLGVDIELHDALNRIRFEHPEVKSVVITSGKSRMFCSGANIYMLGLSSHAWKVNFCKFTNETRNGIEDSSRHSGLKFIAAVNGTTAGGGYELALACDEIVLVDDRSSTVSLPEVPLLGVLPGTGGLTRLIDKRKVRRDLADVFCTTAEGVRADRAKEWSLVDDIAKPQQFAEMVKARALELAQALATGPADEGVALTPLGDDEPASIERATSIDADAHRRRITGQGRREAADLPIERHARDWWPLRWRASSTTRSSTCAHNELDIGTWILKTRGDARSGARSSTRLLEKHTSDWFVRETIGYPAPHARAPRRLVAHPVRADRAGLVLRRHARSSSRSPPTAATCCAADESGAADRAVAR